MNFPPPPPLPRKDQQHPINSNVPYFPNQNLGNRSNQNSTLPPSTLPPPPMALPGRAKQQQQYPLHPPPSMNTHDPSINANTKNINGDMNQYQPPPPPKMNSNMNQGPNRYQPIPPPPRSMNNIPQTTYKAQTNQYRPNIPPPPRSMNNISQAINSSISQNFQPPPPPIPFNSQQPPPPFHNNPQPPPMNTFNGMHHPPINQTQKPPQPKPTSKIDPSQIPRPTSLQTFKSYTSTQPPLTAPPPPPNTRIHYRDSSNATPSILRPTSYIFPNQRNIQEKTGLPIGLVLTPLGDSSSSIPLFDGKSIIRCRHCNAYIQPSCNYNTNSWVCNFCTTSNAIQDYGLVSKIIQYGTIEYNVNNTVYDTPCRRSNISFIYALHTSILKSNLDLLYNVWMQQLQQYDHGIGIILYENHTVYIPYLSNNQAKLSITCDMDSPFAILPLHDFILSSIEDFDTLVNFLQNDFTKLIQKPMGYDCLGSVLHLLNDTLKSTGGKCIILTSNLESNIGSIAKVSKTNPQYIPDDNYKNLTSECIKNHVSIDLFYIQNGDEDDIGNRIPTKYWTSLLYLCYKTCGRMNKLFGGFDFDAVFKMELLKSIEQYKAQECILKLRISPGIKVKKLQYHPGTLQQNDILLDDDNPEIELSSCTKSTSISILFDYKIGGLHDGNNVHFQMGFLYTNAETGDRILRISTLTVQSSRNVHDVFRFVDTYALSLVLLRTSAMELLSVDEKVDIDTIKHTLMHTIIIILKNYRCNTNAKSSPSSQLILPDTCQLLPLLLHASFTSPLFKGSGFITMNQRLEFIHVLLYGLNPMYVFLLFYPCHLYPFHHEKVEEECKVIMDLENTSDLDAVCLMNDGDCDVNTTYTLQMDKNIIYPSRSNIIETKESYLFDNGYDIIYIYHPPNANSDTIANVQERYGRILTYLRSLQLRPRIPRVELISSFENMIFCDDTGLNGQSYEDFLCFLHKRIRLAMQQDT